MAQSIVRFGEWISEGWDLFAKEWKKWTLMGVAAMVPMVVFIFAFYVLYFAMIFQISGRGRVDGTEFLPIFGLFGVGGLILMLYTLLTMCGMYAAAHKQVRGESFEVSDVWKGASYMLPMVLLIIINSFLAVIGFLLCFFPVFIVQGLVFLSYPILVRENCGPIEAMQKSWAMAKQDWFMFTLFALVVGIISQVGVYLCLVGIFFTYPLQFTIGAVAYRDCFEKGGLTPAGTLKGTKPCKTCGKAIPADSNFCDNCGAGQV